MEASPTRHHPNNKHPPNPVQANNGVWTTSLARECQFICMQSMVVGEHQPPWRIGAMRVTHGNNNTSMECVNEDCM